MQECFPFYLQVVHVAHTVNNEQVKGIAMQTVKVIGAGPSVTFIFC